MSVLVCRIDQAILFREIVGGVATVWHHVETNMKLIINNY